MSIATSEPQVPLYEQVAKRIEAMIDSGALAVGTRAPSVRKLSAQLEVSISTVLAAYRILEDRGVLEARPQSGFYVRGTKQGSCAEVGMTKPHPKPASVETAALGMALLQEHGPSVVGLGAALGAVSAWPARAVNRLMASIGRSQPLTSASYDHPPGNLELRKQIARRAVASGCSLSPDDIVITCGSLEAMHLCLRATTKPGDTVAIESPTYFGILQTIELLGLKALEIPTHPREGVSLDALRLALDQGLVKTCLFVPNVNNPLGSVMPDEKKRELVRLLAKANVPLIEDDIYGDLCYASSRPSTCKSYDTTGNVMLCAGFSKTIAAGLRIGWVAAGKWTDEVARLKVWLNVAAPTLPQLAIARLLDQGGYEHHLRKVRSIYRSQVERVSELVAQHFPEGTRITRPQGGFVLWVEMPEGIDSVELHRLALERGISIAPGVVFSAQGKYRNCIRLNCGLPWSDKVSWAVAEVGTLARRAIEG